MRDSAGGGRPVKPEGGESVRGLDLEADGPARRIEEAGGLVEAYGIDEGGEREEDAPRLGVTAAT